MKCSFCDEQALFKCNCNQPYFCQHHLGPHLATLKNHPFELIDIVIEAKEQKKSRSKILDRLEKIEKAKAKITSKSKALISLIQNLNREEVKKLDAAAKYLLHLYQQEVYCPSEKKDIESFKDEEMVVNSVFIDEICERLEKIYREGLVSKIKISKIRRRKFLTSTLQEFSVGTFQLMGKFWLLEGRIRL